MSIEETPLYQILNTKYDLSKEYFAIGILAENPNLANVEWRCPKGIENPFIERSTILHYASNDGKIELMKKLIELGANVNADQAHWYATPLSWAANNASIPAIKLLLANGASPTSLHAMHAVACGGSSCGKKNPDNYVAATKLLIESGADLNDIREPGKKTPYQTAISSGNTPVAEFLKSQGAI